MTTIRFLITVVLLFGGTAVLKPQNTNDMPRILQLTAPGEEAALTLNHPRGRLDILGYDGFSVILLVKDSRGIEASELKNLDFSEKNNQITLFVPWPDAWLDLELRVPHHCGIAMVRREGKTTVRDISAEVSITQESGTIEITQLAGAAILNTVDGNISVQFVKIPLSPMVISSFSGNIETVFPECPVSLRVRSDGGVVRSEFTLRPEFPDDDPGHSHPWQTARLMGGGPELLLRSVQGNIRIRIQKTL